MSFCRMRNFLKISLVGDLVDFLKSSMFISASLPSCPWIGDLNMKKKSHVKHHSYRFFLKPVTDDLN